MRGLADTLTRHSLVAAVVAPMVALVAFSSYVVADKLESYRKSADLLATVEIARTAHSLARELESERTLSALFLGTNRQSWRSELDDQRRLTDERADALRARMLAPKAPSVLGAGRMIPGWGQLEQFRAGVDGNASVHRVMENYGGLIGAMLGTSSSLSGNGIGNLVSAFVDLGNVKDRVAQARSIGATWLLKGRTDPELLQLLASARAELRAFLQSFRSHASPDDTVEFNRTVAATLLERIDTLHRKALAGKLTTADAEAWHRGHLDLTGAIANVEGTLAARLDERVQDNMRSAQMAFYAVLSVVVVLVGFSVETLRRSERRASIAEDEARKLFRAVEQSPVSILITDLVGRIEYVNPAFTRMTGFGRDDVLGHNPRLLRSPLTPDTLYRDMWQRIGAGNEWRGEIVNQRRDGTVYWEHMTVAPVKGPDGKVDSFIALKEDVTEVRSLRQALEREHANLRRVLEGIHDGIALTDLEGRFEYVNPALLEQFGSLEGKRAGDLFDIERPPLSEPTHRQEWRSRRSGRTFDVAATWVHNSDSTISLLRVFHDITARKQVEDAINDAREAAELANRAKTEFLATMSHELRTPLNAIIGFSEIIESELLGPVGTAQYRAYAHDIHESGQHLLQLINDILDMARLDVGRVVLHEECLAPSALIRACAGMVGERAHAGGVHLRVDLPEGLPLLWADEGRVKQVLVNVLGNAVKFTPTGGHVMVAAQAGADGLAITVSDTGIGIAPRDLAKVMAPFGQADSSMARRFEGSGLGLPLSRKLMDLHGGQLRLESRLGTGTIVTLHFPAGRLRPPA